MPKKKADCKATTVRLCALCSARFESQKCGTKAGVCPKCRGEMA